MKVTLVLWFVGLISLTGCSSMKLDDFSNSNQRFVLEEYFSGRTTAWGIYEDRFGTVKRQFVVDITGKWDGQQLILDEEFTFADGEMSTRQWRIKKLSDGRYEGRADDVIGVAMGQQSGNALNWQYVLELKIRNEATLAVSLDDWMLLQPGGVLVNRARMSKFGVELGQITITFMKETDQAALEPVNERQVVAAHNAEVIQLSEIGRTTEMPHPSIQHVQ